jgi:hypothetical protein
MNARAVQALAVVLGDGLPVGVDAVDDPPGAGQVAQPVARQVRRELADVLVGCRGAAREIDEHEALDDGGAHGLQPVAARVELLDAVGVRRVAQRAVEAVGPRVVGALQAWHPPLGLLDDARASMAAGVQEGMRLAVVVRDDEHALAADLDHDVVAARADLVDVADADPAPAEEAVELPVEHAWIRERRPGQHRRAFERLACALKLADRQGQHRVANRHGRSSSGFQREA